jgi:serine/threonine-protein kinase
MDDNSASALPLESGQRLGQYVLEEAIARRQVYTATQVFRARDEVTGQTVALKVLALSFARLYVAQRAAERFQREVRIMKQLKHPHILSVLDFGWNAQYYWIVMPFCQRGTLAKDFDDKRHFPYTVKQACSYAIQICEALDVVHHQNPPIIHRDVKPHNMLFVAEGQLALSDFGIAHIMDDEHLTEPDKGLGTPEYMAPEQWRPRDETNGENIDPRVDIYALGCVLYELLSGHPPFEGAARAIGVAHLTLDPKPLSSQNGQVNLGLALIVRRALAKDPADRYQSAQAFKAALAPFIKE